MIRFKCLDRLVDFDKDYKEDWTTEIRAVLVVTDEDLLNKAKKIDKEYFCKNCFGIAFNYVHNENKIYLLGNGLYYVDNGGDDNYLKVDKNIIIRLQNKVEQEYKKYLEDNKKYLDTHKYLWVEEL